MAKKLIYDQNIAPDQEKAFQNHWCVDTGLGLELLDCILLDLHADGKLTREEYKNMTRDIGGVEDDD